MTSDPHQPAPLSSTAGGGALGVILVAAGRGERLGAGRPKAFVPLLGRTLIEHCVDTVTSLESGGQLVVVVPEALVATTEELVATAASAERQATLHGWRITVTSGGQERHESVRLGIAACAAEITTVLVHDAARPLAPANLFVRVADEVERTGESVIPALPVVDTIKRVSASGVVHETVDRAPLVAVQTPQGFPRVALAEAHALLASAATGPDLSQPTDDAEVIQRAGGTVRTVAGDALAHKLTVPSDVDLLAALATAAGSPASTDSNGETR